MEHYVGATWNRVDEEVAALVKAAYDRGVWLYTELNGVGLIADPRPTDPNYAAQLLWTFEKMFYKKNRAIVGQRAYYQNLVPELQAFRHAHMERFAALDVRNNEALIEWLLRFVPVTWCPWACTTRQARELARRLPPQSTNIHVQAAKQMLLYRCELDAEWYQEAEERARPASG